MPRNITNRYTDLFPAECKEIVIVSTGFIALDAFACNLKPVHLYIIPWQETLLDLHGQIQGEFQLVTLFQTFCHFIDDIARVSDSIVRCDPDLSVKLASADFLKKLPDIP